MRLRLWLVVVWLFVPSVAEAGYTHYWTWHRAPDPQAVRETLDDIRRLVAARPNLVTVTGDDRSITIEGLDAMEAFVFPGDTGAKGFNFCKTGLKPYDEVVTAA